MVAVACITNNLSGARTYPQYWCPSEEAEESTPSNYFMKFLGANAKPLPAASPPLAQTWCSFLGAFVGIGSLALVRDSCQWLGKSMPERASFKMSALAVIGIIYCNMFPVFTCQILSEKS